MSFSVTDRSLRALADDLAAGAPGHGGGVAAAATATLAAALLVQVARVSGATWPDAPGVAAQAAALRERATGLADAEVRSYAVARDALADLGAAGSDGAIHVHVGNAATVPAQIAAMAGDIAELAVLSARHGKPELRADAALAAVMAEGVARSMTVLVDVNLTVTDHDGISARAHRDLAAASAAREVAQGLVD